MTMLRLSDPRWLAALLAGALLNPLLIRLSLPPVNPQDPASSRELEHLGIFAVTIVATVQVGGLQDCLAWISTPHVRRARQLRATRFALATVVGFVGLGLTALALPDEARAADSIRLWLLIFGIAALVGTLTRLVWGLMTPLALSIMLSYQGFIPWSMNLAHNPAVAKYAWVIGLFTLTTAWGLYSVRGSRDARRNHVERITAGLLDT